jgi:putative SOS response-associated peptidase YedK
VCGRFVSSSTPDEIAAYFDAAPPPEEAALEPSWNVAPTDDVYVIVDDGRERRVAAHHWGLVPFWAKDPSIGNRMINARADGVATKNAYKHAFAKRRCIVPADGFYEWRKVPGQKAKQPYYITRADGEPMALAGLWEEWRHPQRSDDGGEAPRLRSTTIITTDANDTMAPIHDRMPVILPPSAWDRWLDPEESDLEHLAGLLVPAPEGLLKLHPVSRDVGNVRNQGPQLVEPVPEPGSDGPDAGGELFPG